MSGAGGLAFDQLHGGYADTTVVRGVSGTVAAGQVLGVLGRNGVGKSTLLKLLGGVLVPSAGRVLWDGADVTRVALQRRRGRGISYTPQDDIVFGELSVADNLYLHLDSRNPARYAGLQQAFPLLAQRQAQRAGTLSGGERKLLSFARALALEVPLTLLDEPTEGVQPENVERMGRLVRERCARGAAFVIVEQHLEWMMSMADTLLVLDHGEVVLRGATADLSRAEVERHLVV
jgi:ABC-type branched-subunit amino acid transport system ATPase component